MLSFTGNISSMLSGLASLAAFDTQVITSHDISSTYMFIGNCIEQMQSSDVEKNDQISL